MLTSSRFYCRCFSLLVPLFLIIIFFHFFSISLRDLHFLRYTKRAQDKHKQEIYVKSNPLHILLVSYARTGSSFIGELLQNLPDTFYYYEPLRFIEGHVLDSRFNEARALLHKLFLCGAAELDGFLQWEKKRNLTRSRNWNYWEHCSKINACFNGSYVDSYCHNRSTVVIKSISLNLGEAVKLFTEYPDLNLKIVYLARDPRGTINSRMKFPAKEWTKKEPNFINVRAFCSSLVDDLQFICPLYAKVPQGLIVIRYEDMAINSSVTADRLVKFLGLPTIPWGVQMFLKTHTSVKGSLKEKATHRETDFSYLTFRNSSSTAMAWKKEMSFEQVIKIQEECRTFLRGMGYGSYSNLVSLHSDLNFDIDLDEAMNSLCFSDER